MAQILNFPYAIWLVFSRIFANKRISVLLIIVWKVKHPWKGIRTLELEPQGAGFGYSPKAFPELHSRNWILNPLCLTSSHHQRVQTCPVGVSGFYLCGTGIRGVPFSCVCLPTDVYSRLGKQSGSELLVSLQHRDFL